MIEQTKDMWMILQTDDQILIADTSDDFNDPPKIHLTWTNYTLENIDNQDQTMAIQENNNTR